SQADHGPYITIAIGGAFLVHAETGRWSPLLHFATPPTPRNYMRNEALLPNQFAHHAHPSGSNGSENRLIFYHVLEPFDSRPSCTAASTSWSAQTCQLVCPSVLPDWDSGHRAGIWEKWQEALSSPIHARAERSLSSSDPLRRFVRLRQRFVCRSQCQ